MKMALQIILMMCTPISLNSLDLVSQVPVPMGIMMVMLMPTMLLQRIYLRKLRAGAYGLIR